MCDMCVLCRGIWRLRLSPPRGLTSVFITPTSQVNACVAWEMPDPSGGGVMPHIFTGTQNPKNPKPNNHTRPTDRFNQTHARVEIYIYICTYQPPPHRPPHSRRRRHGPLLAVRPGHEALRARGGAGGAHPPHLCPGADGDERAPRLTLGGRGRDHSVRFGVSGLLALCDVQIYGTQQRSIGLISSTNPQQVLEPAEQRAGVDGDGHRDLPPAERGAPALGGARGGDHQVGFVGWVVGGVWGDGSTVIRRGRYMIHNTIYTAWPRSCARGSPSWPRRPRTGACASGQCR